MDWEMLFPSVGISLVLTVFGYLLVPTILALTGKKYEAKKLKRINIINCVVVWLLFRTLEVLSGNDPSSGAAVFLWGSVGYLILKTKCLKSTDNDIPFQENLAPTSFSETESYISSKKDIAPSHSKQKIGLSLVIFTIVVALIIFVFFANNTINQNETIIDTKAPESITDPIKATEMTQVSTHPSYIEYDSYYVGIRTITIFGLGEYMSEYTALSIRTQWQQGGATEECMIELMDQYGAEQGGGQLYIVEPGQFVDEVDTWCFDRNRQIGDVAIIENPYGYTICYFSSIIKR